MAKEYTLEMIKEELDEFLETEELLKERGGSDEVAALFRQRMYSRAFVLKAKADILMWEQGMGDRHEEVTAGLRSASMVDEREEGWNKKLASASEVISLPRCVSQSLKHRKPNLVKMSSGVEVPIRSWKGLVVAIAKELIKQGRVTRRDCPACWKGSTPLLTVQPPIEKAAYYTQLPNGIYVYSHGNSNSCVQLAIQILKQFGEDPAKFHLRLRAHHAARPGQPGWNSAK